MVRKGQLLLIFSTESKQKGEERCQKCLEICLFVCNRGETMQYRTQTNYGSLLHSSMLTTDDTTQYHSSCPIKEVRPSPYTGVPKAGVIISPVSTDGVTTVLATG